jgi:hypothetical protein
MYGKASSNYKSINIVSINTRLPIISITADYNCINFEVFTGAITQIMVCV